MSICIHIPRPEPFSPYPPTGQPPDYARWVKEQLALKQDKLTFDTLPVEASQNPVTSGGVFTALAGKASLVNGKVPAAQLPGYVDDVLEFASRSEFPDPGEQGKLYVARDTNAVYRWGESAYILIASGPDAYIPWAVDWHGNPTAVTIGSRDGSERIGRNSLTQGEGLVATAAHATARGLNSKALATGANADGLATEASADYAHSEGAGTKASAPGAHSEGRDTRAAADYSHAEGRYTRTSNAYEHAEGLYNKSNLGTLHSIGFGSSDSDRRNAVETMQDGKTYVFGLGGYDGTNPAGTGIKDLVAAFAEKQNRFDGSDAWEVERDSSSLINIFPWYADYSTGTIVWAGFSVAVGSAANTISACFLEYSGTPAEGTWTFTYGAYTSGNFVVQEQGETTGTFSDTELVFNDEVTWSFTRTKKADSVVHKELVDKVLSCLISKLDKTGGTMTGGVTWGSGGSTTTVDQTGVEVQQALLASGTNTLALRSWGFSFNNKSFYLPGDSNGGTLALVSQLPSVPVQSVNGKTGAVVLTASDVGAWPTIAGVGWVTEPGMLGLSVGEELYKFGYLSTSNSVVRQKDLEAAYTLTPVYSAWVCDPAEVTVGGETKSLHVSELPDGDSVIWALYAGSGGSNPDAYIEHGDPNNDTAIEFTSFLTPLGVDSVTATRTLIGYTLGSQSTKPLQPAGDYAPLASPAFTGTPTAPTPTSGDDSQKVATTAFVQAAVAGATPNLDYVMRVDPETGGIYYTTPDNA